jgi:type IV pilus assembly protein PilB
MTDQELFKELVNKKVISEEVSNQILREAALSGSSAEELLYERRVADEVNVAKVKSALFGAPYKKIDPSAISQELLQVIPKDTSQNYRIIPIEKRDGMLVVGMLHPDDIRAQEALRFIAKRERVSLGVYVVTPTDLSLVWRKYVPYRDEIEAAVKEMNLRKDGGDENRIVMLEEGARSSEDAPIIKVVAATLRHAIESGASDIHVEPQRKYLRIRFRLDGELKEVATLPAILSQPIISRIKVLSSLKLDETRVPQDGRFRTMIGGREIDFRVATFPTPAGEKVALRVLDSVTGLKGLKEIGVNDYNFAILERAINAPFGMILISGPTGSGKSTTLYAIMQVMNKEGTNIVTLEDPVEYFMNGINQSQVKPEIGYTFASGLRQILRQDPDVIMVGEIRDAETAGLAVNAALTGHRMLSTIHTNNSLGVIPRLIDLGVPQFLLPSALNVMLAQRLVGRLCGECKKLIELPNDVKKEIQEEIDRFPEKIKAEVKEKYKGKLNEFYHAEPKPDCKVCKGKGVSGRIALFEIFDMTKELGEIVAKGFTEVKLWEEARRQGMLTLRQDGIIKALDGTVSIEEVLRETSED